MTRRNKHSAGSGNRKGEFLQIRLNAAEKRGFEEAAQLAGLAVSAWVRERLRIAARRELIEADRAVPFLQQETEGD